MGDVEIDAMLAVSNALEGLEDDAQGRVLRWAAERYNVEVVAGTRTSGLDANMHSFSLERNTTDDDAVKVAPAYEHMAEMFAKAQPKSDADRALVAAYRTQVIQGYSKWQAADLQKQLKDMGHAVNNITDALNSNINKKPQRVIQLQKAGTTRQSRRTYKVTHEGLIYVQGMLGGGSS
jgi:hypothetical protein